MTQAWKFEFYVSVLIVLVAWVAGQLAGYPHPFVVLGLVICLLRQLSQLSRFMEWLKAGTEQDPPEARGAWGEVMDQLYIHQREQRVERQRLEFELKHLKDSFAVLRDGVVVVTRAGIIEWCNLAAEKLLGLRLFQDRHHPIMNFLREPAFREHFTRGESAEAFEFFSPANTSIRLQLRISEFGNGDRLLVFTDITRLYQMEQMRRDFVSNASHELRTPLTVIRGYLETMQDTGPDISPRLTKAVDQMVEQARRMDDLIADLLKLSSLETLPQGAHAPVDIPTLCEEVAADVRAASAGSRRQVLVEGGQKLVVLGQREELRSAISNLAMNAARYGGDAVEIRIRWEIAGGKVRIDVEDNGIGIEASHIPRLTERFYRVDSSRTRETGGTGLGLAIVKHVLLRHGGELSVRSEPGKGSCFTCELPIDRL